MPNRILKESICASEDLNALTPGAEILFYRLMVKADDFGAFYGNPQLVKNACFPLKTDKDLKEAQVARWLTELSETGLIIWYTAEDGRSYLQLTGWAKHQQQRAKTSKFPLFDSNCKQMIADDSKCLQMSSKTRTKTKTYSYSGTRTAHPSREEVREYVKERKSSVDPDRFFDFYETGGWKDSKGKPVVNWKQKLISWEQREKPKKPNQVFASCKRLDADKLNSALDGMEKILKGDA